MKTIERIVERLVVCWHVLTKRNYVFFALDNDAVVFDDKGRYDHIKSNKLAAFDDFDETLNFSTRTGIANISWFIWSAVEEFAHKRMVKIEEL